MDRIVKLEMNLLFSGCVDELCELLRKVNYLPGDLVLLLGDLVAKGPKSKAVIR